MNGAEFHFGTEVTGIKKTENGYLVSTTKGGFETKTVINAAGVYADRIHNMVCSEEDRLTITPR